MIELSEQQRQALEGQPEIRVVDPRTNCQYVVVQAEVFERMRRLLQAEVVDPSFFEFTEPS